MIMENINHCLVIIYGDCQYCLPQTSWYVLKRPWNILYNMAKRLNDDKKMRKNIKSPGVFQSGVTHKDTFQLILFPMLSLGFIYIWAIAWLCSHSAYFVK